MDIGSKVLTIDKSIVGKHILSTLYTDSESWVNISAANSLPMYFSMGLNSKKEVVVVNNAMTSYVPVICSKRVASTGGVGSILAQAQDGREKVISYASRT